jgi:hypothetical protein
VTTPCGTKQAVRILHVGDVVHATDCNPVTILGMRGKQLPITIVFLSFYTTSHGEQGHVNSTQLFTYKYLHRPAR